MLTSVALSETPGAASRRQWKPIVGSPQASPCRQNKTYLSREYRSDDAAVREERGVDGVRADRRCVAAAPLPRR